MLTDKTLQSSYRQYIIYNDFCFVSLKVVFNVCCKQCKAKSIFLNNIF